jgi:hypothetical protein
VGRIKQDITINNKARKNHTKKNWAWLRTIEVKKCQDKTTPTYTRAQKVTVPAQGNEVRVLVRAKVQRLHM